MKNLQHITLLILGLILIFSTPHSYAQCPATYTYEGAAAMDDYGEVVAVIGDYNNDGFNDYAVGDSENDESHTRAGKVDVFNGSDGSLMFTILGEESFDRFGIDIDGDDDINGDGIDDMIIGSTWWGPYKEGRVYIFFGEESPSNADASEADIIISGTTADAEFGDCVDVTNTNVLVGAPLTDANRGKVFIFNHSDLTTPGSYNDTDAFATYTGEAEGDYFGYSLAGINRFPSIPDYIDFIFIGAHMNDDGGTRAGKVYVVFPNVTPAGSNSASIIIVSIIGETYNGRFGSSIAEAGLLDDNSYGDFIIGEPNTNRAYIFFAQLPAGVSTASDADIILERGSGWDMFGESVSSAGDFNGDGRNDVVVGESQYFSSGLGKIYVFSGDDGEEIFSSVQPGSRLLYGDIFAKP